MEPTVAHRSFSQFTSWLKCGKAYELERVLEVKTVPAWYLAGGSAVHAAIEQYLKGSDRVRK